MQGRLSETVDGKIQAFPWSNWENEFPIASELGFELMEWTLDQFRLFENPLMTNEGQTKIRKLSKKYQIQILSLTGDCFMQSPFWKVAGEDQKRLKEDFLAICRACSALSIRLIVVPLVDNGRLDNAVQENILVDFLLANRNFFIKNKLKIIFESDYLPADLARFMTLLPEEEIFGVNYDIGNSAAFGFNPSEEFSLYGNRVLNVHVKDRLFGGSTVPLNTGSADFKTAFKVLSQYGYKGNYILQTARAIDGRHATVLCIYRDMTKGWIETYGA